MMLGRTNSVLGSALSRGLRTRWYSSASSAPVKSFFQLFPQTFPNGGPPKDGFRIPSSKLRKEFRRLQSEHHPDILIGSAALNRGSEDGANDGAKVNPDDVSAALNKAYTTVSNPYTRLAHIIEITHPDHLDISQDDISKDLISHFQSQSEESSLEYKSMLMTVLDAHEALEFAENEDDLEPLEQENEVRIEECEEVVDQLLKQDPLDWNKIMLEAIRMKYWVNIQNGIKEWEPGKPVHLTH